MLRCYSVQQEEETVEHRQKKQQEELQTKVKVEQQAKAQSELQVLGTSYLLLATYYSLSESK